MSEFQTQVNTQLPNGVPGDVAYNCDHEGVSLEVMSATADNHIGYVYTRSSGSETMCEVGGTGVFAGIGALSKATIGGTVDGGASMLFPQYSQINVLSKGVICVPYAGGEANIGDALQYNMATGLVGLAPSWGNADAGNISIRNASVAYHYLVGGGVLTIKIVGL